MKIAIVNQSTSVSNNDFYCMVAAARLQISNEFSWAWGTERGPADIEIYSDVNSIPDGYWVVTIVDDPEQSSYFGYHVNTTPVSQSIIFADTIINYGCPVLHDPNDPAFFTVSSVLCHELLEMIVDPCVNDWWDGPGLTLDGHVYPIVSYAAEVCDPVYFGVYTKTISGDIGLSSPLSSPVDVNVCNFIYPAWKDVYADSSSQFDQMEVLTAPFSLDSGGYMLVRNAAYSTEEYVYGAQFPANFREFTRRHSRTANRLNHVPRTKNRPVSGHARNIPNPFDKA